MYIEKLIKNYNIKHLLSPCKKCMEKVKIWKLDHGLISHEFQVNNKTGLIIERIGNKTWSYNRGFTVYIYINLYHA